MSFSILNILNLFSPFVFHVVAPETLGSGPTYFRVIRASD